MSQVTLNIEKLLNFCVVNGKFAKTNVDTEKAEKIILTVVLSLPKKVILRNYEEKY